MAARSVLSEEIPEATSPVMTFQIVDSEGVGFKPDALLLTLYNYNDRTIINNRDQQNVLDLNDVSVDDSGNVRWLMRIADTPIVDPLTALERHIAMFAWTWDATSAGKHEIEHRIRNFATVGA